MDKAKKGDRVLVQMRDGKKPGVVAKVWKGEATVILDGGKYQVKAHIKFLELTDLSLPKDPPNVMDKYSIKEVKSAGLNTDGEMWSATLLKNGKPIAHISQGGFGGPNEYSPEKIPDPDFRENLIQFRKDASKWAELFGHSDFTEPEDTWTAWWIDQRPYGKTAADMFKEYTSFIGVFGPGL